MPGGSWKHSARNYRYEHGLLKAELKDVNGFWIYNEIRVPRYVTLSNRNGRFIKDSYVSKTYPSYSGGAGDPETGTHRFEKYVDHFGNCKFFDHKFPIWSW